jgi:hypothetical protein
MKIWPWTRIRALELEVETLRMQLMAVSLAAKGEFRGCRPAWQSDALRDVLEMQIERPKFR